MADTRLEKRTFANAPPWGLALALALLLGLELVLRSLNPKGAPGRIGGAHEGGYRTVVHGIEQGVGDVVVIGSSRARRGVLAPVLKDALQKRSLSSSVTNFSLNAAQAEELELLVRRLGESSPRPKLLVWAITARELEERDHFPSRYSHYLVRPSDWLEKRRQLGSSIDAYLPAALRNEAARWSFIARYRFSLRDQVTDPPVEDAWQAFKEVFVPEPAQPSPMEGGLPSSAFSSKRNATRKLSKRRVKEYLGDAYTQPNWPHNYQAASLEAAVEHAQRLGIDWLIIEIPVHEMLEANMPPKTQQKFRSYMGDVGKRHGVRFVSVERLEASFDTRDFVEQSHLNYRGSVKYTEAIAPFVAEALQTRKK
jgi:hypothetical protein